MVIAQSRELTRSLLTAVEEKGVELPAELKARAATHAGSGGVVKGRALAQAKAASGAGARAAGRATKGRREGRGE